MRASSATCQVAAGYLNTCFSSASRPGVCGESRSSPQPLTHSPHTVGEQPTVVCVIGFSGYTRRILAYDPQSNKFVKCADMKDRRMHHGATVMGNKLYVTGGRRLTTDCNIEDSASFDCYDPEMDTWTSQGQLPHKLFDHACLSLQCIPHKTSLS